MIYDVCVMGHITKDIAKTGDHEIVTPGGTVYYTAVALKSLGMSVAVITKLRKKDISLLDELENEGIPFFLGESDRTTTFMNLNSSDPDKREQQVKEVASPFTVYDASRCEARIFHLGPLTKDEIPLEVIRFLSGNAKISLDVQGFVREIVGESRGWRRVRLEAWKEKTATLAFVNIIKANEEEAKKLSHELYLEEIAAELSGYGPEEVVITSGSSHSLVYSRGNSYRIPAYPPRNTVALDTTGCGDTYMAGYLFYRERSANLHEVGKFAAMTASLKLERRGPFRGSKENVRDFAKVIGQPLPQRPD